MEKPTTTIKNRYVLLIVTLLTILGAALYIIHRSAELQRHNAFLISKSGKQRMLSQSVAKFAFAYNNDLTDTLKTSYLNSLKDVTDALERSHKYLVSHNKTDENNSKIDSLLLISEPYLNKILSASRNISANPNATLLKSNVTTIAVAEPSYLLAMDAVVSEYQKVPEEHLKCLVSTMFVLAIIAVLLFLIEYLLVYMPGVKYLLNKNRALTEVNEQLSISKNNLKESKLALNKLNAELRAILNTGPVSIISIGADGIIKHFNYGAELLTGYSASEIIGIKSPKIFHLKAELDLFRVDIATKYGIAPQQCNPFNELAKHNEYDTREWTCVKKDGTTFPIQLTLSAILNDIGEKIGVLGISFDISERKKIKDELLQKNQLLNLAEEINMMGHWYWDVANDKVQWSNNLYNIFELDKKITLLNFNTYFNFVHPDDKELVSAYFDHVLNTADFKSFTHHIVTNGKIKTVQLQGVVYADTHGKVIKMIGTCQDISQQRIAENKFKGLLESAPDAMVIVNEKREIQIVNKQAEVMFGYTSLELLNKAVETLIPASFPGNSKMYQDSFYGNPNYRAMGVEKDLYGIHKNGIEIPIQISLSPLETEEGLLISAAIRNITLQKTAENELLRKNQLLLFAEKITKMGNWQWNLTTNILQWSSNLYRIFGVEEGSAVNFDTYFGFVHPEDKDLVIEKISLSLNGNQFNNAIHRIVLANGTIKTIQLLAINVTNDEGKVIELIGTCQDVTEQKMAENKFRGLLESAPDAMVIVNEKGKVQLINNQAEKLFGYTLDELLNKPIEAIIPKQYTSNHRLYEKSFFSNPNVREMGVGKDLVAINKEGNEIPIQISLSPLETKEGLLVSTAIRDITLQKKAKNELIRKNQLLSFAERITLMGNWQWNLITNKVLWSVNLYDIFGQEEGSTIVFETYFNYVHPDDKERVSKHIEKSFEAKSFDDLLHRILLKDGTVKIIHLLAEFITNPAGELIELIGACQDVTKQKMAENKFRGLLESAPDAMVIMNENWKIQLINKQAEKLFGYTLNELLEKSIEILIPTRFSSDQTIHQAILFNNPEVSTMGFQEDLFGINKENAKIPIQISLSPLETEEGLLISVAIRDITVQKQAENRILQAKESLEVLTEHLTGQNKKLAEFAHITSHNLRAPVSNLNALLHLYEMVDDEEEKKVLFEKFELVISHLTTTLNTLVEAIKTRKEIEKPLVTLHFEKILAKTKEIISGQIIETNTTIRSDFSKTPTIKYHKTYMESIFLNLITNAIKYSSPDRKPDIFIQTDYINGKINLTFRDNGLGIDLKRHGHKLFGLNKTFHRHPEAKGVGLYLTKIQVETMGGSIFATSEVNKGSIFTVIF
ncbi:PAS domain S-box protein [Aequorivita sp. Q41]|uniref:PAS domain S-box protein n=1 Tax=Aequorivita sp. Q41 TaxID=3153300 RepID=UPI003241F14F